MKKLSTSFFAFSTLLFLAACMPALQSQYMLPTNSVYTSIRPNPALKDAIEIGNVTVAANTGGMAAPVNTAGFREALETSLLMAGYAKRPDSAKTYVLDANVLSVDYPLITLDIPVTSKITYTLREKSSGKTVYQETLTLSYTALFAESLDGTERARIGVGKAIRENITHLTRILSAKKL